MTKFVVPHGVASFGSISLAGMISWLPSIWRLARRSGRALSAVLLPLAFVTAAIAQSDEAPAEWQTELNDLLRQIEVTEERRNELQQELAALDQDRAALNEELIETNQRIQGYERDLDAIEGNLATIAQEETVVTAALLERRDVLAEVLAVLQRMGQAPPPALIVQPEDALAAVRGAILLGAVVPEVRAEADALIADIEQLVALREERETERNRVVEAANLLLDERERLELLLAERRQTLNQTADTLAAEQARLGELADNAQTLEELIAAFETPNEAANAAEVAEPPQVAVIEPGPPILLGEADRINPAVPFASARGLLPRPANGDLLVDFGGPDGLGGTAQGLTIATRAGARIAAPSDGWVEFAGSFRSYGNLLIIDAGGGYRVVLAGMERIDVQRGQFVLAGEPIGAMRSDLLAAVDGVEVGTARPVLYLEFRKDGESIDPGPWWADPY